MKSALRATKNFTFGFSDVENKVRNATSNSNLPPSGQQMHELAVLSYDRRDFTQIMEVLDKRLNDKGKNWKHIYKSLCVIDYLLHTGSPAVASYFRENLYLVKTLRDFQYVDDEGKDVGSDVRIRARDVTSLLMDDAKLMEQRQRRKAMRARMMGTGSLDSTLGEEESHGGDAGRRSTGERSGHRRVNREEADLARAIKLSEEEEKERARKLAESNGSLFDNIEPPLIDLSLGDSTASQPAPQAAIIQPQYTQVPVQPQYTQAMIQPQMTIMQPQFTAYDPYSQQAQYEAMIQADYMRQQAEAQQQFLIVMQAAQQQQPQQQKLLVPQPTAFGSNNPFAHPEAVSTPATPFQNTTSPTSNYPFLSQSPSPTTFRSHSTPHAIRHTISTPALTHRSATASSHASSLLPKTPDNAEYAQLERLYRKRVDGTDLGGGVDTFGNMGSLRYGGTSYGQLVAQRTGAGGRVV